MMHGLYNVKLFQFSSQRIDSLSTYGNILLPFSQSFKQFRRDFIAEIPDGFKFLTMQQHVCAIFAPSFRQPSGYYTCTAIIQARF